MICLRCRHAADNHLGAEDHCDAMGGPGSPCDCGHRTDRYRPQPGAAPETAIVIHVHQDSPHIADEIRDLRRHGLRGR